MSDQSSLVDVMNENEVSNTHPRIAREKKTVSAMIKIYCNNHHDTGKELCQECKELQEYSMIRLDKCKYQEDKTTCAKCPTHCYKPSMRERIRETMKYSGPRMLLRHPILAIFHIVDGFRKPKKA
jgi:hypothetical protein